MNLRTMRRVAIPVAVLALAIALLLMFTYEVMYIDWTSFMEDQPRIGYQEPPRRLAAEGAVPVSQPAYLDAAENLANPVPADDASLQRGQILFALHCAVCHGSQGRGNGPVVDRWKQDARPPANLTAERYGQYPDNLMYTVVKNGLGGMPPLRENLTERQIWDVINYVHTLQP